MDIPRLVHQWLMQIPEGPQTVDDLFDGDGGNRGRKTREMWQFLSQRLLSPRPTIRNRKRQAGQMWKVLSQSVLNDRPTVRNRKRHPVHMWQVLSQRTVSPPDLIPFEENKDTIPKYDDGPDEEGAMPDAPPPQSPPTQSPPTLSSTDSR